MPDPPPPPLQGGAEAGQPPRQEPPRPLRLFIAFPLPPELLNRLARLIDNLKKGLMFTPCRLSWTSPETLHLTLRFLGPSLPEQAEALAAALDEIARSESPLRLKARDLDVFPDWRHPRVLWVGVEGRGDRLRVLQGEIESLAVRLGYRPEKNAFHPHLTLGRFRSLRGIVAARKVVLAHGRFPPVRFHADRIILYRSELSPAGARHYRLHEAPLGEPSR